MSGTFNRTAIPGTSSNLPLTDAITIVTAQPGTAGNVSTTQTITLIPTQHGSSRSFPAIKTITLVKGQPGSSVTLPPTETVTAEPVPSSILPPTETVTSVTASVGQGDVATWNFENLEEKNPLSELSEEHLNKLDEVLASADVQEILQQTATNCMNLEGGGDQSGSEPVELQESDLAVLSAAFTDHAYAVHPNKAPKTKPVVVTTVTKPKPIVVTVGPNEVYDEPVINVPSIPSVVPQSLEPPPSLIDLYPSSPSSVESSPRKSGRVSKVKRFGEEDWVTSSPRGKGRGRGLVGTESPTGYGNKRQSSRISDQKQRELAEKILQANRQALEAEKMTGSSAESFLGGFDPAAVRVRAPGWGTQPGEEESDVDAEESDVDVAEEKVSWKGRGRGRGMGRGKKAPEEEAKVGKQNQDDPLNESTASSQLDETLESDTEKTTDDVKTTAVSDSESEHDEEDDKDSVADKKETVKKKPVKKRSMWEPKRRKKKKKAVKAKAKVTETETEETVESESEKSDSEDDDGGKDDSKTKTVSEKRKKVGKVKEKLKGKKGKGKVKKKTKDEDSEESDMETDEKSKGKKTVKKLTKKERIKKLKEAKKAKKAKLLEKKNAKLKEKKLKKGKAGKGKDSAAESNKSPKKKKGGKEPDNDIASVDKTKFSAKKKGIKEMDVESASVSEEKASPKKTKKGQAANAASPVKKKKVKASEENDESEGQGSPKKKKAKLGKEKANSPVKTKKGKQLDTEMTEESESDQKKGKKKVKGKKDMTVSGSPVKKTGKQKDDNKEDIKKSPTKAGKRKDTEETDSVPAKKPKLVKTDEKKLVTEGIRSDSDEDVPLQKIKTDLQEENTPLNQIQKDLQEESRISCADKETGPDMEKHDTIRTEQNIEGENLSPGLKTENTVSETVTEPVTINQSIEEIDVLTVDIDNSGTQESVVKKKDADIISIQKETGSEIVNVTGDKNLKDKKSVDKKDGKRRLSGDKDSFEMPSKRRDNRDSSKDSKDHHRRHSSHHHRHSRDSRESDRKDSHKDRASPSRRKESHGSSKERQKSGSVDKDRHKTESHDRKSSVSKDGKDSKKDLNKPLKKDERQGSITGANSDKKKVKTPGKVEKKKSRKSLDDRVDSLWTDLFTPDVTPNQKGKLKKESSIDETGAGPKKTSVIEDKGDGSKAVLEKEDSVSSQDSALNKTETKDKVKESSVDRSDTSIFDKFKDLNKTEEGLYSEKVKVKEAETEKGINDLAAEQNTSLKSEAQPSIETKSEIKSETEDASTSLKTDVDDSLNSASQKTEIKEETPISANEDVKTEQKTMKDEKVKIGDSKSKAEKTPVSSEIKKEKASYDKEKLKKKLKDKARRMKEKLSESNEKDKKGLKKDKLSSKPDRSRSLSSEKGRKLSPEKTANIIKLSPAKKVLERHRKLSDESARKKHLSGEASKQGHGSGEGKSRPTRNKAVAFAEILKKEKLGSDDNEEASDADSDYNDDETDETWEEPGKLYCICRQPHNKRFMICCDKCEEWFHGKCVGISRARGEEMEKNDEEYICPQCSEKEVEADAKVMVTSTESPDQSHKKAEPEAEESKDRVSLFESISTAEVTSTHQMVEKSDSQELPRPDSTVSSPTKRDSLDSQSALRPKPSGEHTPTTPTRVKHADSGSPRKLKSPEGEGGKGYIRKRSPKDTSPAEKKKRIKSFKAEKPKVMFSQRKCLCGCNRLAKVDSLFWGKECEVRNKEQRREEEQAEAAKKAAEAEKRLPQERRIAVVEKGTGKTLTGHKAPRESELGEWLQKHPTFEILKSHRRLSSKDSSRDRASDSSEMSDREKSADDSKTEKPLPEGPEPVRLNVRKGLRDALAARADAADDIVLANSEIKGLALSIEEEMFKCFKDTDHKYKAKYRSLVFNIKDHKNKGLFRKILNRRIRPYQLVRMTPEELASQELSKWREHETKHQIEMIEQTEEALLHEHPHIMKKTHKGEEEVEAEGEEDLSSLSATELKKEATKPKIDPKADLLSSILPDTTDQHGKHLFDSNCSVCTGKIVTHPESSVTSKTTVVHDEPKPKEVEPEPTQVEKDRQAQEVVKEVLKAIKLAQAEAEKEKAEAQKRSSSVTVRSPDSALSSGLEKKAKFTPSGPMLWKGFVYMQDVSKFVTSAYRVTGPADHLDIPDTIHVCGRINPEHVWDYLAKIKQAASRDICVIRFIPGNNEEKVAYINLYSYLNSRSRCGVVQNSAKHIKDFYIVPLASHSKIPSVLKPFDGPASYGYSLESLSLVSHSEIPSVLKPFGGPGLEENRCHMLIGVIIRNKVKPGSVSGTSGHQHKQDPRKLKSNLKDPTGEEKSTSSASSSPTSSVSASSVTSQEKKKKKAKSISFDPIVKEYSHVPSDQEEPDVSYDPNAPYDPEKEAETTSPKQEDKPYSPGQDELFGIAESLKTSYKHKSSDDPVSKMIEKIALSKNPVEATATMVAALATSSRLGNQNQRKLLLELTKKVDEQKKALERKRLLAGPGKSPSSTASPSEKSGSSDVTASTSISSPHANKSHVNRNDPRLKPKKSAAESTEAKDSSVSETSSDSITHLVVSGLTLTAGPAVYSPLKDLQAARAAQSAAQQQTPVMSDAVESKTDSKDGAPISPTVKPFFFTIKSKSHPVAKSVIDEEGEEENKVKLPKLDEEEVETLIKPKGFYVDHGEKASPDQDDTSAQMDSSKSSVKHSQQNSEVKETSEKELNEAIDTETALSSDQEMEGAKKDSNVDESDKTKKFEESVDKQNVSDKTESPSKLEKVSSGDFDIISHLQAEVSGTAKSDTVIPKSLQVVGLQKEKENKEKETKEGKEALDILSQLHASVWGTKTNSKDQNKESSPSKDKVEAKSCQLQTDSSQSPVKLPQNILNILKEVTDKPGVKTQPKQQESQQTGQLPKSLMSLFSGIPSDSKPDSEGKIGSSTDEDLRLQSKKAGKGVTMKATVNPSLEAKAEIKVSKEKLPKSLLGFDYDSDSDSEGSFEGFDDDGLKSLSPRKRKLVAKQSPARSDAVRDSTNEFGDVDIRVQVKQTGISEQVTEDTFEFPAEDVDLRQQSNTSMANKDKDERIPLDKDERFQSRSDFLPPGEEWDETESPADIDERVKKRAPPGVVFTTPDAVPVRPPPLHDVDHRQWPFPPGPMPPGLRPLLPFMGSNQPPPPGEDWQPGQPAPPPLPFLPPGVPPPLPKELPPPLPKKPPKDEVEKTEKEKLKTDEKEKDEKVSEDSKEKLEESGVKDKKDKKKKKDKKEKKKGGLMTSDEILKARVLEIARNEPIEPPPLPPILNPPVPVHMPTFSGPPQLRASAPLGGPTPLSGPPSISGPPTSMMSMPGPVLTQSPTLNPQPTRQPQHSIPVSSHNRPYPSQGPHMPQLTPEGPPLPPKSKKWQGRPATASPGPPSLFDIEVKPTKRLVLPPDGMSPSPPPLQPNLPPSKQQGLLPTPQMPPNQAGTDHGSILGTGQFNPQNLPAGPSTVSSIGPPPVAMQRAGSVDSSGLVEGNDSYPPPLPHGSEDYGEDRGSRERGPRDRYRDRHSSQDSRERDSDRHRHGRHRNDRDYRSNRDRYDRSDRHSSERFRDDHRSDRRSSDRHRDYDRNRDNDSYRDERGDRHRNRGRDDHDRHKHRSRH